MKKRLPAALLAFILAAALFPAGALAAGETEPPSLDFETLICDPAQKYAATGEFWWSDRSLQYQDPTDSGAMLNFSSATDIKIYDAETGGSPITDGSIRVEKNTFIMKDPHGNPINDPDGNPKAITESLDFFIAASPAKMKTYYIAAQEPGMDESDRVAFNIAPFDAVSVLMQRLELSDLIPENDANTEANALAAMVALMNTKANGLGITATAAGAETTHYNPPKYGLMGGYGAFVNLSNGARVEMAIGINANEYTGGKYFELDEGTAADFVFSQSDATAAKKTVMMPLPYTSKLQYPDPAYSALAAGSGIIDEGYFAVSTRQDSLVSATNISAGKHYVGPNRIALTYTKPEGNVSQELYLWFTPKIVQDSLPPEAPKIGLGDNVCIGKFTVNAKILGTVSDKPAFNESELGDFFPVTLNLTNGSSFGDDTVYRVYTKSDSSSDWEFKQDSYVRRIGDILIVCYSMGVLGRPPYSLGITATQPDKAESDKAVVEIKAASEDGTMSKALMVDDTPKVLAAASIAGAGQEGISISEISKSSQDYWDLLEDAKKEAGNVVAAYELALDNGASLSSGSIELRFFAGTALSGKQVLVAHKKSGGETETFTPTVDANGFAEISVDSLSPFMVCTTNALTPAAPAQSSGSYVSPYVAPDAATGAAAPSGAGLAAGEQLVTQTLSSGADYNALLRFASSNDVIGVYDISLSSGKSSVSGGARLKFALGSGRAGQAFTLVHKKADNTYEYFYAVADANGDVSFGPIYSFSPFLLARGTLAQMPVSSLMKVPATGAQPTALPAVIAACAAAACIALLRRRKSEK